MRNNSLSLSRCGGFRRGKGWCSFREK